MKYTTLSIAIAAGIAMSLPAQAAKPVWPDTLVQLHGAGNAYLIDTKTDAVIATLETCKGGTLGITTLVEKMHHTIQLVHPPLGASRAESTRGLTGLIYRSIRGTTRVIGKGLDAGLAPVAALLPEGQSSTSRNAWVSAINGVYGDHLERTANPLAIDMSFLHAGNLVDHERPGDVVQEASGRVLLAIHGLCLNEQHWARDGHHRISIAKALGQLEIDARIVN